MFEKLSSFCVLILFFNVIINGFVLTDYLVEYISKTLQIKHVYLLISDAKSITDTEIVSTITSKFPTKIFVPDDKFLSNNHNSISTRVSEKEAKLFWDIPSTNALSVVIIDADRKNYHTILTEIRSYFNYLQLNANLGPKSRIIIYLIVDTFKDFTMDILKVLRNGKFVNVGLIEIQKIKRIFQSNKTIYRLHNYDASTDRYENGNGRNNVERLFPQENWYLDYVEEKLAKLKRFDDLDYEKDNKHSPALIPFGSSTLFESNLREIQMKKKNKNRQKLKLIDELTLNYFILLCNFFVFFIFIRYTWNRINYRLNKIRA